MRGEGKKYVCLSQETSLLSEVVWLSNKNNSQTGIEWTRQHHEIEGVIDDDMNRDV